MQSTATQHAQLDSEPPNVFEETLFHEEIYHQKAEFEQEEQWDQGSNQLAVKISGGGLVSAGSKSRLGQWTTQSTGSAAWYEEEQHGFCCGKYLLIPLCMKALQAHMYVHHVHACSIPGTTMYAEEPILVFYKSNKCS